jgi:hypothetical protein
MVMELALRPVITAGVALAGASIIAVTPVAPPLPDIQVSAPAVQLSAATDVLDPLAALAGTSGAGGSVITDVTSTADGLLSGILNPGGELSSLGGLDLGALLNLVPAGDPFVNPITTLIDVIATSFANIVGLGGVFIADPAPILEQVITNQIGYAMTLVGAAQSTVSGLVDWAQGIPSVLQSVITSIASGDITGGLQNLFDLVTIDLLLDILTPLLNGYSIVGDIATNIASLLSPSTLEDVLVPVGLGFLEPPFSVVTTFGDTAESIIAAASTGDFVTALSDIVNLPVNLVGAFLNGDNVGDQGILSPTSYGTIFELLSARDTIAAAITPPVTVTNPGDPADLTALLGGGGLADLGGLLGGLPADLGAVPADLGTLPMDLLTIF